jgi:CHAT domain-containing protein/Tfp pilus assembly protein PilF
MRRALIVHALFAAAIAFGCGRSDAEVQRVLDSAQQALRRGALDDALASIDAVQPQLNTAPTSRAAHQARLLRAEVLVAKPDVARAAELLDTQVPSGEAFAPLRARDRYLRARIQVARGQLKQALVTADSVREDAAHASGTYLDAEILAGQILLRLGKTDLGEARLKEAVARAAELNDRYRQVRALNDLGMGFVVRGRYGEALPWFERVLAFDDLADTSIYATALNNAGLCYRQLGEFDRAVATQRRAVGLHEARGAAAPLEQALGELGSTYLFRNELPDAVRYLNRALETASAGGLTDDAAIWARNLAVAHIQNGNWDEAERANDAARRLTGPERARKLVFNLLNEAQIAAGRGEDQVAERRFREVLDSGSDEPTARWAAHEGLAVLASRAGDNARAIEHLEAGLAIIERTRSEVLKADFRMSFLTRLIRFYRQYVELLVEQGQVERALAIADSSRGRVLSEQHGITAAAASAAPDFRKAAARSNRVFASYWLSPTRSYLWIVDGRSIRLHTLPKMSEIEPFVREHHAAIHNALADPLAAGGAGDRLTEILIEPLQSAVRAGGSIVIVPDGPLHGLNFETLPVTGADGRRRYWIEDVEIEVAPSLTLFGRRERTAATRSLLVVGNPTPRAPEFPALRYAAAEMTDIARHFGDGATTTFSGERASPRGFRDAQPERFGFVHFTAHATANRESPLDSAVILSGPDDGYKLYARDVAELPLTADLVTVSACRSAGERIYSGEGLVGFAWAFLRAGAHRVIAGLWDVDDRSTAELMDTLYARLAAGDAPPRALRRAKLALIAHGGVSAKPYYWGPFQVFSVI